LSTALAILAGAAAVWASRGCARDPGEPVRASITEWPEQDTGWIAHAVVIETSEGLTLNCAMRRPSAGRYPLPAALISGGFRTGRRAALLIGEFRGVAFSCDYPWRNPGEHGVAGVLSRLPRIRSEIVSTPLAHRAAATWLLAQPFTDSSRLAGIGVSLGVPTVAAWAAGDPRVKAVALLYGGADLGVMLEHSQRRNVPPDFIRRPLAGLVAWGLKPLEPARTVPRLPPRPLFLAVAPEDRRIPPAATEALVAAAGPSARVMRLAGGHVTPNADTLLAMLTDSTNAWLQTLDFFRAPSAK